MMKKIKGEFYKLILFILLILVMYVLYCSIFDIYNVNMELKPIIIIIGTIILILGLVGIKNIVNKLNGKTIKFIVIFTCIVYFIFLSIFGNIYKSVPTYDLSNIISEANNMLKNGGNFESESYFARYETQVPITILVYSVFKFGTILGLDIGMCQSLMIVVNSLFITITAYFTYLSVNRIKDSKIALVTLMFFFLNPIFYLYSSYFYTDTLCMPFAAIVIYLLICSIQTNEIRRKVIYTVISGIVLAIGFKIRVVLGILLIGYIIGVFLNNQKVKDNIIVISCLVVSFIVGILGYNLYSKNFGVIENKNLEFPVTHYLMYGFNDLSDGKYNSEDFSYTLSKKNYEEKINANIDRVLSRLESMKLSGLWELQLNKLAVNWSNGDYDYLSKLNNVVEHKNIGYEYIEGNKIIFILYYLQICKVTVMILFTISIIAEIRKESKYKFIYISIFGMFIFYMLWEVLSRYSLTCLPWIIVLIHESIENITQLLNSKEISILTKDGVKHKIHINKILRVTLISIIILTIFFIFINYDKYCIKETINYDKVTQLVRNNGEGNISDIYNKTIKQTFVADKKFNSISIKFMKQGNEYNNIYHFELKNSKGEILIKQMFYSKDITNNNFKKFNFDYINPKGEEKYIINIYCADKALSDGISIAGFNGGDSYEAYKSGMLMIDDVEKVNHDICFKVENENKRSYMSKNIYILISCMIIALELVVCYPYIKK